MSKTPNASAGGQIVRQAQQRAEQGVKTPCADNRKSEIAQQRPVRSGQLQIGIAMRCTEPPVTGQFLARESEAGQPICPVRTRPGKHPRPQEAVAETSNRASNAQCLGGVQRQWEIVIAPNEFQLRLIYWRGPEPYHSFDPVAPPGGSLPTF